MYTLKIQKGNCRYLQRNGYTGRKSREIHKKLSGAVSRVCKVAGHMLTVQDLILVTRKNQ